MNQALLVSSLLSQQMLKPFSPRLYADLKELGFGF